MLERKVVNDDKDSQETSLYLGKKTRTLTNKTVAWSREGAWGERGGGAQSPWLREKSRLWDPAEGGGADGGRSRGAQREKDAFEGLAGTRALRQGNPGRMKTAPCVWGARSGHPRAEAHPASPGAHQASRGAQYPEEPSPVFQGAYPAVPKGRPFRRRPPRRPERPASPSRGPYPQVRGAPPGEEWAAAPLRVRRREASGREVYRSVKYSPTGPHRFAEPPPTQVPRVATDRSTLGTRGGRAREAEVPREDELSGQAHARASGDGTNPHCGGETAARTYQLCEVGGAISARWIPYPRAYWAPPGGLAVCSFALSFASALRETKE